MSAQYIVDHCTFTLAKLLALPDIECMQLSKVVNNTRMTNEMISYQHFFITLQT